MNLACSLMERCGLVGGFRFILYYSFLVIMLCVQPKRAGCSVKVGDLVSVKTKCHGTKLGILVQSYHRPDWKGDEWRVKMLDHARDVHAAGCDIEVISEYR